MDVTVTMHIDEHHRRLIFWDLHDGKEGIASDDEVKGWIENRIDHDLQNLSDLKGAS